ncbi:MAG: glycosyltransferase family 4 protein [Phycisphaerae bacterium]
MKIGFQIEHLDPARGGAETYVYHFAEELVAAGHQVHLFAAGFAQSPPGTVTHRVLRCGLSRPERDWRFARGAGRAACRAKLDVVVAVGRTFGADVLQPHGGVLAAGRRQNLFLVRSQAARTLKRASDFLSPRVRMHLWLQRRQFAADPPPEVVAISRMVRRDMQEFHAVPDERLHLVYNGVDVAHYSPTACECLRPDARRRFALADGQTCFLLVAHNFRLKGLGELVEAAALLHARRPAEPWRILVVGKGNAQPYLHLAAQLGCFERLAFAGALADILPAYAAADAYVHPTWYDPCSLVVLEALACGLPVVTTQFNGASELVQDGREALLLDLPRQTERLADAMDRLLDPARRAPMGLAARRTAEQYPVERNFREMMTVLARAAERKEAAS